VRGRSTRLLFAMASDGRSKAAGTVKRLSDFISAPSVSGWSTRTSDVKEPVKML
jgi:hypothetical protein